MGMEVVWKGMLGGLVTALIVLASKRGNILPGILPLAPTFAVIALLAVGAKGDPTRVQGRLPCWGQDDPRLSRLLGSLLSADRPCGLPPRYHGRTWCMARGGACGIPCAEGALKAALLRVALKSATA